MLSSAVKSFRLHELLLRGWGALVLMTIEATAAGGCAHAPRDTAAPTRKTAPAPAVGPDAGARTVQKRILDLFAGGHDAMAVPTDAKPGPATYRARVAFVAVPANGVEGRIELLEDDRIRSEQRPMLEDWYHGSPCDPSLGSSCASMDLGTLLPARVRLVDDRNREIAALTLELPFAEIKEVHLRPDAARRTYLVTVDMSAGGGSTNGPLTRLLEVMGGTLRWASAVDGVAGATEEIDLTSSARSAWRLTKRPDGSGEDLLELWCPLVFADAGSSRLLFIRYSFEKGAWRKHSRSEAGWWENGRTFPPRDRFP